MRLSIFSSLLTLWWSVSVDAYALPMGCSGVCNKAHDPALIRRGDGTYYRFSTNNKLAIHTAPSILGPWTYKGPALPNGSKIPLKGNDDLWVSNICVHHLIQCTMT